MERPDASTTKRILSELVVAVESLHNAHIHHGDLGYKNILIDNKGHLLLTDFSLSERSSDETDRLWDWKRFRCICLRLCCGIHIEDNCNDIEENLIEFLKNMTDTQLPGKLIVMSSIHMLFLEFIILCWFFFFHSKLMCKLSDSFVF